MEVYHLLCHRETTLFTGIIFSVFTWRAEVWALHNSQNLAMKKPDTSSNWVWKLGRAGSLPEAVITAQVYLLFFETLCLFVKKCSSQRFKVQKRSLGKLASTPTSAVVLIYEFERIFSWLSDGDSGVILSNAYFSYTSQANQRVNRPYVVPVFVYFNLFVFSVHLKDMRFPLNR